MPILNRPEDMARITTPEQARVFIQQQIEDVRAQVGDKKVLLALSGGVDSSVVAALLIKAIGKQLFCVHVNHGLLRKGEPEQVIEVFRNQMDANLIYVDATDRFLNKLAGVTDPEEKRKIIGGEFIEVFAEEARKVDGVEFLAQGTIWPDILESEKGIKAHHNAGGLPEDMKFELVEPVRILFKDEVRVVGKELGLPDGMVYRQPFPGPGLGVRCPGAITRDRLEAVRESDAILREEGVAVFHRCAGFQIHRRPRRQAHVRVGGGRSRRQYPRRDVRDRRTAAPRTDDAPGGAHHLRGARREPRAVRFHAEADRDDRVGIMTAET